MKSWRRRDVLLHRSLSSLCPLSDHWECFFLWTPRRRQHHNHVYSVSLSSAFPSVQIIFSPILFFFFFVRFFTRKALASAYLTVKFCNHGVQWILKCSKHHWTVAIKHLDYYCCFLTWKPSRSPHTTFLSHLVHLKLPCLHTTLNNRWSSVMCHWSCRMNYLFGDLRIKMPLLAILRNDTKHWISCSLCCPLVAEYCALHGITAPTWATRSDLNFKCTSFFFGVFIP